MSKPTTRPSRGSKGRPARIIPADREQVGGGGGGVEGARWKEGLGVEGVRVLSASHLDCACRLGTHLDSAAAAARSGGGSPCPSRS